MTTTTLLDLADSLTQEASEVNERASLEQLQTRVNAVASELDDARASIEQPLRFLDECRSHGITQELPESTRIPVAWALVDAIRGQGNEPILRVVDGDEAPRLRRALEAIARDIDQQARNSWTAYCTKNIPLPQPEIIQVLETKFKGPTSQTIELRSLDRTLAYYRSNVPLDRSGAAEDLIRKLNQRAELWNSLGLENIPPSVRKFIRACSAGGAPLSMLTAEVLDWLHEQNIAGSYRIIPHEDEEAGR
jgi:hypothetical protein